MINTIFDEVTDKKNSSPYLDSLNGSSRGDVTSGLRERKEGFKALKKRFFEISEEGKVNDEISKAEYCGKTYAKFTDIKTESKNAYKQLKCFKFWCPTCGGINGELHNQKYDSVLRRINIEDYFIREVDPEIRTVV